MNINGIPSNGYEAVGTDLYLKLNCTVDEALAMDVTVVEITTDTGDLAARGVGYVKTTVSIDAITGEVTLKCVKDNSETLTSLIKASEDSTSRLDTVENAIVELAMLMGQEEA